MNKHTKMVVGVLITVLIVLIAATISFSMDISKNSDGKTSGSVESTVNPDGNQIVCSEDGLYGMSNSNGSVIIEPEWEQLRFMGTDYLAASDKTNRVGVLDVDGNIVVPFVYSDVYALTAGYYLAEFADSDRVILYDSTFRVFDAAAWDSCEWADGQLTLTHGENTFYYTAEEEQLLLEQADLSCDAYNVSWNDNSDAAMLSPLRWSYASQTFEQLLSMIKTQDFSLLNEVTDAEHENKVLSGSVLKSGRILRNDTTAFLSLQKEEKNGSVLVWQIGITVGGKETDRANHTLSVTLAENQQGVWVATDVQIA